jgi:hypothetical protein
MLFMAVNGVTESFLFGAITPKELVRYNALLVTPLTYLSPLASLVNAARPSRS